MESYWAAFIGAFSAFLFMRLADVSNKIYERQVRNYNALVKLEHFCLEKVDDSAVNVLTVDGFCSCLQESVQKNQFIFYRNKFQRIDFDEALLLDMRNLAFMNHVLSFKVCLRRLNQDMDMINTTYNGICEGVINKNIVIFPRKSGHNEELVLV